jgi:DNA-directed RNA polymerase specialized sigma24 family protein
VFDFDVVADDQRDPRGRKTVPMSKVTRRKLATAARRRDSADSDVRSLVVKAHEEGASLREIAEVVGITHAGVRKMLARETGRG